MNILVMADGLGSRWGNNAVAPYKQLLDINGTPLICRTLEQVKPYQHSVIVIAPEEFIKFLPSDVACTSLGYRELEDRPLLDGILRCKPFWTETTYVLLGDVIYSNKAIKTIFEAPYYHWVMGRDKHNNVTGKQAHELFSFVFNLKKVKIEYNLKSVSGKLWNYYFRYEPDFVLMDDYTDDIDSLQAYEQFYPALVEAARLD